MCAPITYIDRSRTRTQYPGLWVNHATIVLYWRHVYKWKKENRNNKYDVSNSVGPILVISAVIQDGNKFKYQIIIIYSNNKSVQHK